MAAIRKKLGAPVFVRTDPELGARVRAYAEREDINISQAIRRFIRIGLATVEKDASARGR